MPKSITTLISFGDGAARLYFDTAQNLKWEGPEVFNAEALDNIFGTGSGLEFTSGSPRQIQIAAKGVTNDMVGKTGVRHETYNLAAVGGAGGVLDQACPETTDVKVLLVDITITNAVAGQTIDVGIGATATSHNNLLDGASIASTGSLNNIDNKGASGGTGVKWGLSEFLTITASGTPTGLVGTCRVFYTEA